MSVVRAALLIALTLAVGFGGGAIFYLIGFPAPWVTGSVVATSLAVLGGVGLTMPLIARQAAFLVLGVSIGSRIDAQILSGIVNWPISLAVLCMAVVATIIVSAMYLSFWAGWSKATAFFASIPGALSYVLATSLHSNANTPLVVLAQLLRVVTLLIVLPLIATTSPSPIIEQTLVGASIRDAAVFLIAGGAIGLILERVRFPAGMLFGGMFGSAALHLSELMQGQLHSEIQVCGQILLGCLMGLRFKGTDRSLLLRAIVPSAGAFMIALMISALAATLVSLALGLPLDQLLIAFAPGALEVMILLAFILGLDPAFVAVHHLARFVLIALFLPLLIRLFLREPLNK